MIERGRQFYYHTHFCILVFLCKTVLQANEWPVNKPKWPLSSQWDFLCSRRWDEVVYWKHNPRCEVTTAVRMANLLLGVQFVIHVKQSLIRHVTSHNTNANAKLERSHCVHCVTCDTQCWRTRRQTFHSFIFKMALNDYLFFSKCFRDGFLPIKNCIITLRTQDTFGDVHVECHDLTLWRATRDAIESRADVNAPLSENLNKISVTTNF